MCNYLLCVLQVDTVGMHAFLGNMSFHSLVGSLHCICIVRKSSSEAVCLHYFIATMDSFRTGGSRPSIPLELLDAFPIIGIATPMLALIFHGR